MYGNGESIFYYLTVMNEPYEMPAMPEGAREGHPQGAVPVPCHRQAEGEAARRSCSAAAPSCNEVIKAQAILEEQYGVGADVWSVTSYSELYREGHAAERWNMLHPGETRRACRTWRSAWRRRPACSSPRPTT